MAEKVMRLTLGLDVGYSHINGLNLVRHLALRKVLIIKHAWYLIRKRL